MATASSPMSGSSFWKVAGWRSLRSTSTTARSVSGSVARTRPSARRPSKKATSTCSTWPTTWALVTTTPSLDQITPLPVPWSWLMVTTDGSTLRTRAGMSPAAAAWTLAFAWTAGAVTGAGADRACDSGTRPQPARASTTSTAPAGRAARRARTARAEAAAWGRCWVAVVRWFILGGSSSGGCIAGFRRRMSPEPRTESHEPTLESS